MELEKLDAWRQDPYHEPGQAHGLAFSVREGREAAAVAAEYPDRSCRRLVSRRRKGGDLSAWARQGRVSAQQQPERGGGQGGQPSGVRLADVHRRRRCALRWLPQPVAFVLWGAQAQKKGPSPLQSASAPRAAGAAPESAGARTAVFSAAARFRRSTPSFPKNGARDRLAAKACKNHQKWSAAKGKFFFTKILIFF